MIRSHVLGLVLTALKETYPDYILGEGAFEAEPQGAVILFR